MGIKVGEFIVMHTKTNTWYYGKVSQIDSDCVAITNASYGHDFVAPIVNPPDHPKPPGGWAYFYPYTEIMWMTSAIYWIARVNKIPVPPEGAVLL